MARVSKEEFARRHEDVPVKVMQTECGMRMRYIYDTHCVSKEEVPAILEKLSRIATNALIEQMLNGKTEDSREKARHMLGIEETSLEILRESFG